MKVAQEPFYFLGKYIIMKTPANAIKAPKMSYLSGLKLSTFQAQRRASNIKTPP